LLAIFYVNMSTAEKLIGSLSRFGVVTCISAVFRWFYCPSDLDGLGDNYFYISNGCYEEVEDGRAELEPGCVARKYCLFEVLLNSASNYGEGG